MKNRRYRPKLDGHSGGATGTVEVSWFNRFGRGFALLDSRNYVGAIREFSAAAEIAEKHLMFESLALSLSGLADAYRSSDNFAASESTSHKAVDVALKHLGVQSITYGICLAELGALYLVNSKADESLDLLEKATLIFWAKRELLPSEFMPTIMSCFMLFLEACVANQQFEKAAQWTREIYDFSKRRLGVGDVQTATTLR